MKKLSLLVLPLMAVSFLTNCGGSKEPVKSSYTLTYTYDNGSDDKYVETYTEDKKTVKPTWEPTYPGYTFDGWFTKPGTEGSLFTFGSTLTADTVVFAHWKSDVKDCIVYFDTNGGSPEIERQIVKEGDYAKDPQIDIKRYGVSFKYWSLQDEEDDNPTKFTFENNKITSDITLHAIYPIDQEKSPLTITCTKGPMTLNFVGSYNLPTASNLNIQWSKNEIEWHNVDVTLQGEHITPVVIPELTFSLEQNEVLYLKGDNKNGFNFIENGTSTRFINISNNPIDTDSEFNLSGNIMSLVDSTDYINITEVPSYCFWDLFGNSNVVSANGLALVCKQLGDACYSSMFMQCKKLEYAPNLPATTLKFMCYANMFNGCSGLKNAPELPAASFNEDCIRCYQGMFEGCNSLNHVKVGFGVGDKWPQISDEADFTLSWLLSTSNSGIFEWKGSENPTSFDRYSGTIPFNWTIKPY